MVDFDVHHGNGTQEVLEGDSNFMFFSIHVHDSKKFFYPGTGGECGVNSDCGTCSSATGLESRGNVVNVPLKRNTNSNAFLAAFSDRIIRRLQQFSPQLILLSAGFDGHRDDPTNGLRLGEEDFYAITKLLKRVARKCCQGRIVSVLEGGYALEGKNSPFRRSVAAHLRALTRDDDDYDDEMYLELLLIHAFLFLFSFCITYFQSICHLMEAETMHLSRSCNQPGRGRYHQYQCKCNITIYLFFFWR